MGSAILPFRFATKPFSMLARHAFRPAVLLLTLAAGLAASGCAGKGGGAKGPVNPLLPQRSERELRLEASELYRLARRSLEGADYANAILRYDQIQIRYPFTEFATQAQLESVYARYRNYEFDSAISAADRFLKEHPRHPHIDYVYYLRGLTNFQRGDRVLDVLPFYDPSKADVSYARRAYDDFALLIQRYPDSRYVGDARARMIFLRNRMAEHELNVIRFYVRRGAHVAVIRRAEHILAQYPGAPATVEALRAMEASYRRLGLDTQADEVLSVMQLNDIDPLGTVAPMVEREEPPPPLKPEPEREKGTILNP